MEENKRKAVLMVVVLFFGMCVSPSIMGVEKTDSIFNNDTPLKEYPVDKQEIASTNLNNVDWWPMFRHDPQHSGYSTSTAPDDPNLLWNCTIGSAVQSSPAVVDGRVFIGAEDNNLYCLDTDGTKLWNYTTSNKVDLFSLAVADNKVYVDSVQQIPINDITIDIDCYDTIHPGPMEPIVSDINNNGNKEIIVFKGDNPPQLYVFDHTGVLMDGWPVNVGNRKFGGFNIDSPSVADLNQNGKQEIIVKNFENFYIYNYDGSIYQVINFDPYKPHGMPSETVVFDLNNDGDIEIISKLDRPYTGRHLGIFDSQGNMLPGWPQPYYNDTGDNLFIAPNSAPSIGNFDDDPELEIVVTSPRNLGHGKFGGRIHIYNLNGSILDGFPVDFDGCTFASPAIGDVNNDGYNEVVFGGSKIDVTSGGGLYVIDRYGNYLPGWPKLVDKTVDVSPALGDFNNDSYLEIVASYKNRIYIFDYQGNVLSGWPQTTTEYIMRSPVIADINNDGNPDVMVVLRNGKYICGWEYNGDLLDGFPKETYESSIVYASPTVADMDNDGDVELIASCNGDWFGRHKSTIYVWDLYSAFFSCSMQWPMFQHDIHHSGLHTAPEFEPEPLIAYAGGPYEGIIGSVIEFFGSATGGVIPYTWYWDFGDGNTSNIQNPVHTYDSADTYTITLTVTDSELNSSVATTTATIISEDEQPPVTTHTLDGNIGENGWYVGDVYVTLIAEDDSSGVDYTMYKLDGGDWQEYKVAFIVTVDGMHNLRYYSVDKAGNKEYTKYVDFKIDQTAPEVTLTIKRIGFWKWNLMADASDETSGINVVEFYVYEKLIGVATEPPYEAIWIGWAWLLRFWVNWMGYWWYLPQAIAWDNAGNTPPISSQHI